MAQKRIQNHDLDLGKPIEISLQNVAPKSIVSELTSALNINKPSILKLFHVMRKRSRADRHATLDIAASAESICFTKLLEYLVTPRISQRTSD